MRGGFVLVAAIAACDSGARTAEPAQVIAKPAKVPLAFALVLNEQEILAGNSDYETDENATYEGSYPALRVAIAEHPPAELVPPDSIAIVIGHDAQRVAVLARGPMSSLTAGVFDQRRSRGRIGSDLSSAVGRALDELAHIDAQRRVLLVVGDTSSSDDLQRAAFPALRESAQTLGVETTIVLWQLNCFGATAWDGRDGWFANLFTTIRIGASTDFFVTALAEALR